MIYQQKSVMTLLLSLLCSTQHSVSGHQLTYADIGRNLSGTWERPEFTSALQINEHISDFIAERVLNFALETAQQLAEVERIVVFSPLSIMTVLAMLMLGASGSTYDELQKFVGLIYDTELASKPNKFHTEFGYLLEDLQSSGNGIADQRRIRPNSMWRTTNAGNKIRITGQRTLEPMEHIIKVTNGIFTQTGYSLNEDYVYAMKHIYHSTLESVDFASTPIEARNHINRWVERHTLGKIRNLIKDNLSTNNKMVIASALYFKGFWQIPFITTDERPFYTNGKAKAPILIQMMLNAGAFPYYKSIDYDCHIVGLPYDDNVTTMYVIQPMVSTRRKLQKLQRDLDANKIDEMISQMVKKSVTLQLPKMHLLRRINLRELLLRQGLVEMFTPGVGDLTLIGDCERQTFDHVPSPLLERSSLNKLRLANLQNARMDTKRSKSDLFVDEILHQVDVEVNEQGTVAAAATAALIMKSGPEINFVCDTPFLFLIRHDPTKLNLFYGMVFEPEI